jgi:hypothetical protein
VSAEEIVEFDAPDCADEVCATALEEAVDVPAAAVWTDEVAAPVNDGSEGSEESEESAVAVAAAAVSLSTGGCELMTAVAKLTAGVCAAGDGSGTAAWTVVSRF